MHVTILGFEVLVVVEVEPHLLLVAAIRIQLVFLVLGLLVVTVFGALVSGGRGLGIANNLDRPLVELVVNERHPVEFWEHEVLLLEDKRRDHPVLSILRV